MNGLTLLALVDTLLQHIDSILSTDTLVPPLVHRTQGHVNSHSVCGIRDNGFGAEVIEPVEMSEIGCRVISRE